MGRREISPAVKAQAIQMIVSEGRSVMQVCGLLEVGPTAVRRWVSAWRATHAEDPAEAQGLANQRRIKDLEAQVVRLRGERDLLKKSIAFFVRESDHPRR